MKIRVSIVEDSPDIREVIKQRLLQSEDFEFVSDFEMGEVALEHLGKQKPDIVLMDIKLPGISGINVMLRLKKKYPEMEFLMFTEFDDDDYLFDSLKAGAKGYVLKEEGVNGVIHHIRELAKGGAPMTMKIARKVLGSFHRKKSQEKLSAREIEVLEGLIKGWQYKELAERLNPPIAVGTLKQHIHRIYKKLEVNNRTEAINKYLGNDV